MRGGSTRYSCHSQSSPSFWHCSILHCVKHEQHCVSPTLRLGVLNRRPQVDRRLSLTIILERSNKPPLWSKVVQFTVRSIIPHGNGRGSSYRPCEPHSGHHGLVSDPNEGAHLMDLHRSEDAYRQVSPRSRRQPRLTTRFLPPRSPQAS